MAIECGLTKRIVSGVLTRRGAECLVHGRGRRKHGTRRGLSTPDTILCVRHQAAGVPRRGQRAAPPEWPAPPAASDASGSKVHALRPQRTATRPVVLMLDVAIHCDEHFEPAARPIQNLAVRETGPA